MSAFETHPDRVVVDVWSDVMCPFCFMGEATLARAAAGAEHPVEVRYHSFQLMPELPPGSGTALDEVLVERRGILRGQASAMNRQVAVRAEEVGLRLDLDRAVATNTRKAHRLTHLARDRSLQHDLVRRLFTAYFTDGLHLGQDEVLADLATQVGLDRQEALEVLTSQAYDDHVDADIAWAGRLGITGVPFFVLDGRYALSGAQPLETFRRALATAWGEHDSA